MIWIYVSEYNFDSKPNYQNTPIQKIKENELTKEPIGRIPEFIESNDIKLQYNKTSKEYEPVKNNSIKKVN